MTEKLNDKQLKAINFILSGLTDQETADKVGVSRETVNTWKNKNYNFKAELNKRRNALTTALQDKQREILVKAYKVLEKSLDEQLDSGEMDIKTALDIIKSFELDCNVLEENPELIKLREDKDEEIKRMFM